MSQSASFGGALLHNTISVVFLLIFLQMLALTLMVKSSQFYQSQGQGYRSKLGLVLKVRVTEQGQSQRLGSGLWVEVRVNSQGQGYCLGLQGQRLGLGLLLRVRVIAQGQCQCLVLGLVLRIRLELRSGHGEEGEVERFANQLCQ